MATILVADDNEQNSNILKDVLESWGHKVLLAASGDRVLEIVHQEVPDTILLDVMMPGLNGYEVCQQLRQKPASKKLPIILLTALGETEDRIHGYNVGADMFMTKPVNYQELQALLKKLLRERKACAFTEPADKVVNFLSCFLPPQETGEQEILEMEQEYGQKLLQEMALAPRAERYLTVAIRLQKLETRLINDKQYNFKKALEELQLGNWLVPILTYSRNKNTATLQALEEQEGSLLLKVASIFLALKTYGVFYKEHRGNSSDALTALRRAAVAGECSKSVVESLASIVKNRMLLEDLVQ